MATENIEYISLKWEERASIESMHLHHETSTPPRKEVLYTPMYLATEQG
jgi:hypothetical protein